MSNSRSFSGLGVPDASGHSSPVWPLPDVTRRSWNFGRDRSNGKRHHAGVDLYAPASSEVLAPEDGVIVRWQRFLGPRAVALVLQLDSGLVVLLGEVFPKSWEEFGLSIGSRVTAGQPVARVGITPGNQSMLHFETYTAGTKSNSKWMQGGDPPPNLLDPTSYLRKAKALDVGQQDDKIEDEDDPIDDPHKDDPIVEDDPIDPIVPQTGQWGPLTRLALFFGALFMLGDRDGR